MADPAARKLLAQTSHYSLASLLTVVTGAFTFPMLTRVFSVRDYGVMSLIGATLSVSVALGKTGLQHAIVRWFTEIAAGKGRFSLRQMYATTILGMAATGSLVMIGLMAGSRLVPDRWIADGRVRTLLVIVAVLVLVEVLDSALTNLMRAGEKSAALMRYQIVKKYLGLGCLFGGILLVSRSLEMYYAATLVAEGAALLLLMRVMFGDDPRSRPAPQQFSGALYRELLAFGLPMTFGYELAGVILNVGDRYVIKAVIGETEVGLYSAAYSLCTYVQAVFVSSVGDAITPLYMRMFHEEGPERTSAFCGQSLGHYALVAAPVVAGLGSVGSELLSSVASDRYASASLVIPWLIAGMVVDGAATIAGAGLFIHRKRGLLMTAVAGSAALNLLCNFILVPRLGILGAAISTLVGYAGVYVAFAAWGGRYLRVPVPWRTVLRAGAAALVMYVALTFVHSGHRLVTVGVRCLLGGAIYLGLIAALDRDARVLISAIGRKLRARLGQR